MSNFWNKMLEFLIIKKYINKYIMKTSNISVVLLVLIIVFMYVNPLQELLSNKFVEVLLVLGAIGMAKMYGPLNGLLSAILVIVLYTNIREGVENMKKNKKSKKEGMENKNETDTDKNESDETDDESDNEADDEANNQQTDEEKEAKEATHSQMNQVDLDEAMKKSAVINTMNASSADTKVERHGNSTQSVGMETGMETEPEPASSSSPIEEGFTNWYQVYGM